MSWLNQDWLGYAATPDVAINIIKQTGVFYLLICGAYLLSSLHTIWHASSFQKTKRLHCFGIVRWGFLGAGLLIQPAALAMLFNFFVTFLSLFVLYQLHYTSALTTQATLASPLEVTDDKKTMYAQTLLKKTPYTVQDLLGGAIINEQILWILILYRAAITLRASWGL